MFLMELMLQLYVQSIWKKNSQVQDTIEKYLNLSEPQYLWDENNTTNLTE